MVSGMHFNITVHTRQVTGTVHIVWNLLMLVQTFTSAAILFRGKGHGNQYVVLHAFVDIFFAFTQ